MKVKHKSALSFLLALVMILSLFAGPAFPAKAAGTDDAWQQITQGMLNWQEEIDITACAVTKDEFLSSIWPQVVTRNPDLFYVWDITYYTDSATDIVTTIKVIYNTKYNRDSVREYEAALDRAYNEVIRTDMSDVQKALALHDYLVQHMEYDQAGVTAGTEKRNAYEALVNGIGVCEGYTLAYAALLEKAGIESDYCESRAMNHIWNYVKLNNNWYHVDVTQDDVSKDRKGIVSHRYFLNSTTQLLADGNHHSLDTTTACTDTSYDTMYWQEEDISAVFPVANKEYFIRARKNDQNLYLGGIDLVERTGSSEKIITHYDTQWILGSTM
ncbi:MAG: hypothetical protein HFI93_10425 [Lachnospiraceae bacterium]|nr:hypothetical protein [Lachnospiraceae bacterium]